MKKTDWKKRLICWAIPLAVGGLAALLSGGMGSYKVMNQPPLSPPGWVFPIVWTILYLLIGGAAGAAACVKERALESEKYKGLLFFIINLI